MPKSSSAIRTPRSRSAFRVRTAIGTSPSPISTLSVISSTRRDGSSPDAASTASTSATISNENSPTPERFACTAAPAGGRPSRPSQPAAAKHARSSTTRSIATTWPVASAAGTNVAGPSRPWRGCSQRASASAATTSPPASETIGWKCATSSPASRARAISSRRGARAVCAGCISGDHTRTWPLPASLARYIATSARRISSSGPTVPATADAIPTEP